MSIIKLIYKWVVYGNLWIALGAAGMTWVNSLIIFNKVNVNLLILSFLVTLGAYNFQRIRRAKELFSSDTKDKWLTKNSLVLVILLIISFVASLFFLIDIQFQKLLIFTPFLIITLLYRWPILGISLRDIPFIKILLIASCWGGVTVLLPCLYYNEDLFFPLQYIFVSALYIVGITIPFDARDLDVDTDQKKTIPQLIGLRNACFLAISLLFFCAIIFLVMNHKMMILHCFFSAFCVSFSYKKRPDWYYSFILDGLLVIMPIYYILY